MRAPSLWSLLLTHWQPDPAVIFAIAASIALYLWGVARVRGRWPFRRTAAFLGAIACLLIALQSGIAAYDDRMLSVHMAQHMLLLLLVPLLLLGGRPAILALRALPPPARARLVSGLALARSLTGPLAALVFFTAVIALTHLPAFYDATLRHPGLHYLEHALYLVAGLVMWSPLVDGDPAPRRRLGGLGRLVYLLVAMVPMALIGAYLNRHVPLVYGAYAAPARALGVSALNDQAQAGAIMWVVGNSIMVAVGIWTAIAAMVAEERRLLAREARAGSLSAGGGGPAA